MRPDDVVLIRSKNAGPFILTIDIIFRSARVLDSVRSGGCVTPEVIAAAYGIDAKDVRVHVNSGALAIKVSMPRTVVSGAPSDPDIYGAQQHGPVVTLLHDLS